jgi:hypothetical protein
VRKVGANGCQILFNLGFASYCEGIADEYGYAFFVRFKAVRDAGKML